MVTGSHACFRRPEFSHDAVTYDAPTPMAARALFEVIHWTPAIRWNVDTITILRPPTFQWMALLDAEAIGLGGSPAARIHAGRRDARRLCCLTDVAYLIAGHFVLTRRAGAADSEAQHAAMFERRLRQGRYFKQPYLGVPYFPATIVQAGPDAAEVDAALAGRRDLGWMLHDVHGAGGEGPRFFRAVAQDGVIDLTTDESRLLAG